MSWHTVPPAVTWTSQSADSLSLWFIVFLWREHPRLPSDSVSPQDCPEPCWGAGGPILTLPVFLLWKPWGRKKSLCIPEWPVTSEDRKQLDTQQLWSLGFVSIQIHYHGFHCKNPPARAGCSLKRVAGTEWILGPVAFIFVVWPWTVKNLFLSSLFCGMV